MSHSEQPVTQTTPKFPAKSDLIQVGRGLLMGGADIIPGVSGGTVALILGIYQRLVTGCFSCWRNDNGLTSQCIWICGLCSRWVWEF